ncbi:hypothetical protein ELQ90_07505 [Labedella phragmitis]|uniref:DUF6993 domain-containing protein n=1 Tax=Labedella phragmitis TaxID=2498849 RepID=A0A3S4BKB5_9MICO|nr:hypothetical protein ELQ90_07505 [Labedella phragmitis]
MENERRRSSGRRGSVSVLIGLSIVAILAACTQAPSDEKTAPAPATTAPVPAVALVPEGSAEDNKPFFDQVNAATAQNEDAGGRDFVDALVASGFDKAAMEVTKDATTLGDRAESIQFSVRWGDSCLIGQFGPAVGGYHSTIQPALGTDRCLIGETRPIDW